MKKRETFILVLASIFSISVAAAILSTLNIFLGELLDQWLLDTVFKMTEVH